MIARLQDTLLMQGLFTVVVASIAFGYYGSAETLLAGLYGGLAAVANTLILGWHMVRAERLVTADPVQNLKILYRCAFERLAMTVALLVFGMGILKLAAAPVVFGFSAGTIAQMIWGIKAKA